MVMRRGFSGSDPNAGGGAERRPVDSERVTSWSCAGSLGQPLGVRRPGSVLAIADRGCATTGLRRGGRREGSCGDGRPHEKGGVEAGTGEFAQRFCQLGQEWVCRGARGFCGEQLPPLPSWVGSRDGESACRVAAATFGRRCRAGVAQWVAGRWGRLGWPAFS
jgi:hypothetical protein